MSNKSQLGFAPIIIVILLAIIAGSSVLILKNIPFNQPKLTPTIQQQSTNSAQIKISPIPIASKTPAPSFLPKKATPTSTSVPSNTSTNNNNSSNNSSNSNSNNNNNTTNSTNNSAPPAATSQPTNTPTSTPTPTPVPTTASTSDSITATTSCNGSSLQVSVSGNLTSPNDRNNGLWSTLVDTQTGQTMIYEYDGNQGSPTIHIAANFPPTGAIRGGSFSVTADGRSYQVKVYAAPFSNGTPSLTNLVAQTSFSKSCP